MPGADYLVVGGGVIGLCVAWGLATRGERVTVIDARDGPPQASTANFGLVWLQTKGERFPQYAAWTRRAVDAWPRFAAELREVSDIDPHYARTGGLCYCLSEADWETRRSKVIAMRSAHRVDPYGTEMLTRPELERVMPGIAFGPDVIGASWSAQDGTVDPLRLMHALRVGLRRKRVPICRTSPVRKVERQGQVFHVEAGGQRWQADRLVLAAGLGNAALAPQLGLYGDVHAERGQILVTERVAWRLPMPANGMRQSPDGTIMIGSTKEGPELDVQVTDPRRAAVMARRATRILPALRHARVVRAWAGLRTMSRDSAPVYSRSARTPGAIAINCHSGITLASLHASALVEWLCDDEHEGTIAAFSERRFDVPTSA